VSAPQVLVVGAGPTGLLLGAELWRRGVPTRVVDCHDAPLGWDRATILHARSLEVFESLGIADDLLAQGIRMRATRLYADGELLGELDVSGSGSRYEYDLSVSEEVTERLLTAHLERHGGDVTRATRLAGLEQCSDRVVATLEVPDGTERVSTEWLVGCDGYHSTIREIAGVDFPGHDYPIEWAVFDARLEGWPGPDDLMFSYVEPAAVILVPLPAGRWRVYLHPTSPTSDLVADTEALLARYAAGTRIHEVSQSARFRTHSRVAATYRVGRVLLAGDAAHVCSPAEGHGMNTGLHDAHNLAWKLALVCRGHADDALLDSYQPERRPVAETVAKSGDRVEAGKALTDPDSRAKRDAVLRCRLADPALRHAHAVAAAELNVSYADSPIVAGDASGGVGPGQRLPETDAVDVPGARPAPLHEHTHRCEHTALVLGRHHAGVAAVVAEIEPLVTSSPVLEHAVGFAPDGTDGVGRIDPATLDVLGVDAITVLVARPDRFVAFRSDSSDMTALERYLTGPAVGR
jgi:2-polyprenyl-6-methoxyphenol hydroxylase-like FAD-dependent oxidoreductase